MVEEFQFAKNSVTSSTFMSVSLNTLTAVVEFFSLMCTSGLEHTHAKGNFEALRSKGKVRAVISGRRSRVRSRRYELDIAREDWKVQRYIGCMQQYEGGGQARLVVKFPASDKSTNIQK